MTEPTAFDSRPDPELGSELRRVLDGPAPEAFLARVRLAVQHAGRETQWEVLARWAPAGLVAALAAAAVFWFLLAPRGAPEPAQQFIASAPVRMELAPGQPETDVLLNSVLEGR